MIEIVKSEKFDCFVTNFSSFINLMTATCLKKVNGSKNKHVGHVADDP